MLISLQRALWDAVTPGLRGVAVRIGGPSIAARFLFDHVPDETDREDVSLAESSVMADFADDRGVAFEALRLPARQPRTLMSGEEWVYLRKMASDFLQRGAAESPTKHRTADQGWLGRW